MAYVYEHWRPDLGRPFWVGKGTGSRSQLFRRNKHYNNIVAKLDALGLAVEVRIVADGLSDEQAYDLEKTRIELWAEQGIALTNLSVGGRGGMSGVKRSEESRAKQSASMTGRRLSKAHREKTAAIMKSPERAALNKAVHTGRTRSEETKMRISAGVKKSWSDPEVRSRKIASSTGRVASEESRAKMRAAKTPEARARISAAAKRQWQNPAFRALVSDTMRKTNEARRGISCAG